MVDPAAIEVLSWAEEAGISTASSRADEMKPCPVGADSMCCKVCYIGPCRLVKKGQTGQTVYDGVDTIGQRFASGSRVDLE